MAVDKIEAIRAIKDTLDDWRDYEESENWREYFPAPIWGNKHPPHEPHPVWIAVVAAQRFYRGRLPHEVIEVWSNLCTYSRQHGEGDRVTQRDLAVENGEILRKWVVAEIERAESLANDPATADTAHSTDFRSVRWFGRPYTFTATQAACVQVLWQNWEQGTPVISELTILDQAGSAGDRLRDVFDKGKHSAWGTMIRPGGKGVFQLAENKES